MNKPFDAIAYFQNMAKKNKLAIAHDFHPCTCSGLSSLEDVLANFQRKKAFICVEDTNDSATVQLSGGWFTRRVFTVYIMHRYGFGNMADREKNLQLCRDIFHQFHSRMIRDRDLMQNSGDLSYLDVENVTSREFGEYVLSGLTGVYFMVELAEPIDLCYDGEQWTE